MIKNNSKKCVSMMMFLFALSTCLWSMDEAPVEQEYPEYLCIFMKEFNNYVRILDDTNYSKHTPKLERISKFDAVNKSFTLYGRASCAIAMSAYFSVYDKDADYDFNNGNKRIENYKKDNPSGSKVDLELDKFFNKAGAIGVKTVKFQESRQFLLTFASNEPRGLNSFRNPQEVFNALGLDSNERILIERAAAYIVAGTKEEEFFKLSPEQKLEYVEIILGAPNLENIYKMFSSMRPLHGCADEALANIFRLGMLFSRSFSIARNEPDEQFVETLREYLQPKYPNINIEPFIRYAIVKEILKTEDYRKQPDFKNCHGYESWDTLKNCLKCIENEDVFMKDKTQELKQIVDFIAQLFSILIKGKNCKSDSIVKANETVFAALGVHCTSEYGSNYVVFDESLLMHPQTWSTPVAALIFFQGHYGETSGRPWIRQKGEWPASEEDFLRSKISNNAQGVLALVASFDMIARLVGYHRKDHACNNCFGDTVVGKPCSDFDYKNITPQQLIDFIKALGDSHRNIEVHLPGIISTEKIHKVVCLNNIAKILGRTSSSGWSSRIEPCLIIAENGSLISAVQKVANPYIQ